MNIAVNLGRVMIMRHVADWLAKHATLPIDYVTVHHDGRVSIQPSHRRPNGEYDYASRSEIHNLYAIAEAAGAEVHVNSREYGLGWQLTVSWNIGQVPVESEVLLTQMAAEVRPFEPVESDSPEAPAAERTPELVAAHA